MINYTNVEVVSSNRITEDIHSLVLQSDIKLDPYPGQFITIDTISRNNNHNHIGNILRRPFSFYKLITDYKFEILFRIVGSGTQQLSEVEEGDVLKILGPLGNRIDIPGICGTDAYQSISLVSGGLGIAPIMFLAQALYVIGYRRVCIYMGFKYAYNMCDICVKNAVKYTHWSNVFSSSECIVEDTTTGLLSLIYAELGTVIDLYKKFNYKDVYGPTFVCAPEPVMRYFHNLHLNSKYDCYCFVEEKIACGIGVCHGCKKNDHLVCVEGPCLNSKDVFGESDE